MARVHTPYPISGSVGNYTFTRRGKKTFLKEKVFIPNKRTPKWESRRPMQRANRIAFGGASKLACHLYSTLTKKVEGICKPYAHNDIAAKLRESAKHTQFKAERYTFRAAYRHLLGMDLSKETSQSRKLSLTPIGPGHCPNQLRISGLKEAAEAIEIHGNAHLELRIQLRYVPFVDMQYVKGNRNWQPVKGAMPVHNFVTSYSAWIPTEILPEEGLTLALPATDDPETPQLVFLMVQWREVREIDLKTTPLASQNIVRLAAMLYSEAMAAEISEDNRAYPKPQAPRENLLETARANPQEYLQMALNGLAAPPN